MPWAFPGDAEQQSAPAVKPVVCVHTRPVLCLISPTWPALLRGARSLSFSQRKENILGGGLVGKPSRSQGTLSSGPARPTSQGEQISCSLRPLWLFAQSRLRAPVPGRCRAAAWGPAQLGFPNKGAARRAL